MPRNTDQVEYITVAVRKDSNLMKQLEKDVREKSQPKSHLIVSYAADYVRLFLQGEMWQSAPVIPIGLAQKFPPVEEVPITEQPVEDEKPIEQTKESEFITSDLTDGDLSIYD